MFEFYLDTRSGVALRIFSWFNRCVGPRNWAYCAKVINCPP
jgi:hypothetical protein